MIRSIPNDNVPQHVFYDGYTMFNTSMLIKT